MCDEDIKVGLERLVSVYSSDLSSDVFSEFCQFICWYKEQTKGNCNMKVQQTLPNTYSSYFIQMDLNFMRFSRYGNCFENLFVTNGNQFLWWTAIFTALSNQGCQAVYNESVTSWRIESWKGFIIPNVFQFLDCQGKKIDYLVVYIYASFYMQT